MKLTIICTILWSALLFCLWFTDVGADEGNPNTFDVTITVKFKAQSLMDIALKEQALRDVTDGGEVKIEFEHEPCLENNQNWIYTTNDADFTGNILEDSNSTTYTVDGTDVIIFKDIKSDAYIGIREVEEIK